MIFCCLSVCLLGAGMYQKGFSCRLLNYRLLSSCVTQSRKSWLCAVASLPVLLPQNCHVQFQRNWNMTFGQMSCQSNNVRLMLFTSFLKRWDQIETMLSWHKNVSSKSSKETFCLLDGQRIVWFVSSGFCLSLSCHSMTKIMQASLCENTSHSWQLGLKQQARQTLKPGWVQCSL